jgi:hypothetical protein
MNGKRPLLFLLGVLALGGLVPRNLAAQLTPVGPVTRADTATGRFPQCPLLAVGADGSFEIAWTDGGVTRGSSVAGRHFSSAGEPTAPAQIRIGPAGNRFNDYLLERIGALPDGFQVFGASFNATAGNPGTFRQRLDPTGAPAGPPETVTVGYPGAPILLGPDGGLYAPLFQAGPKRLFVQPVSSSGSPLGRRILLNSRAVDRPDLRLASLGGGDFVAVWFGLTAGKHPRQVIRARVVRDGVPVGEDFDVNAVPGGLHGTLPGLEDFAVGADPNTGGFAVLWEVLSKPYNASIHLRFFDASGRPRTPEVVAVPSPPAPHIAIDGAAFDDAGRLLLLWAQNDDVLLARVFSAADGRALGPALPLASNPDRFICGDAAWSGDSWLVTYWTAGDDNRGEILWRRFAG